LEISFQLVFQGLVNGLALGWLYVLMALGLTLIFGIMHIMQFAHGEIYMLGAYVVFYLTSSLGLPLLAATGLSMLCMAGIGILLERSVFRPLKGDWMAAVVAATGLTLIMQSGAVAAFGLYERSIPGLAEGSLSIMGSMVPKDRLAAVAVAIVLSVLLYGFLKATRYGQAMVASAQSPEGAILQGIAPNRMAGLAMAIGCALAASGGALAGSLFELSPFMGGLPLVKGLTIIVLGGMGSMPGALVGGMILGLVDGVVPVLLGQAWASMGPLFLVVLILIIKPTGLFGHE
jgi:branched-chain amino acid transport system permease protein